MKSYQICSEREHNKKKQIAVTNDKRYWFACSVACRRFDGRSLFDNIQYFLSSSLPVTRESIRNSSSSSHANTATTKLSWRVILNGTCGYTRWTRERSTSVRTATTHATTRWVTLISSWTRVDRRNRDRKTYGSTCWRPTSIPASSCTNASSATTRPRSSKEISWRNINHTCSWRTTSRRRRGKVSQPNKSLKSKL